MQAFIIKSVILCLLTWQFYKDDPEDCSFGVVSAKGEYREKSNFHITLDSFVDGQNAGWFVTVKRKLDGKSKYVL